MYTVKLDKDYTKKKHPREQRQRQTLVRVGRCSLSQLLQNKGRIEPVQVTVCVCSTVIRLPQCQLKQVGLLHLHLWVNMRHLHGEARVS